MRIIKYFYRTFRKNTTFSVINLLGLSLGLVCTILILLWVNDQMQFDRFHKKGDQIYRVIINFDKTKSSGTCGALAPTLKQEIPEITESVRLWHSNPYQLYFGESNIKQMGNYADPSFFDVFTFPMVSGDPKTALLEKHSVVISESVAHSLFGNEPGLGKTIQIRNRSGQKELFKISGVMQDLPRHSLMQFDFLFSFELLKEWYYPRFAERWSNYSFPAYVLVQKNTNIVQVEKKISACYQRNTENKRILQLQPLADVYLNANINNHTGGNRDYLLLFTTIAFLILLVASINYINLTVSHSTRRSKEIGVKKTLGASRGRIIFQYFMESFFYALLALILSLIVIYYTQPVLKSITGVYPDLAMLDPDFGLIVTGVFVLTILLAASYPALFLSSTSPSQVLKNLNNSEKSTSDLRSALVIFQFTLSIVIIIASFVTFNQMQFIQQKDLGFDKENLVTTWTSGHKNEEIRHELLKNPYIKNVGASGAELNWIGWWQSVKNWENHSGDDRVSFGILEVGYHFAETYGVKLAAGRFIRQIFLLI